MYLTYVSKFKQKNSMKNISLHGLFLKSNGSSKNIEKSFKYEGFSFGGREKINGFEVRNSTKNYHILVTRGQYDDLNLPTLEEYNLVGVKQD